MATPVDEAELRFDAAEIAYRDGIRGRATPDEMAALCDEAARLAQAWHQALGEYRRTSSEVQQDTWLSEYLADLYRQFAAAHREAAIEPFSA